MIIILLIFGAVGIGVFLTIYLELPYRREKKRQEEFEKKYQERKGEEIMKWINEKTVQGDPMDTKNYYIPKEERHGHWEAHAVSIKGVPTEVCSVCGEWTYGNCVRFCPNCGAKMDEKETDQQG